jgi:hypothetical protein
MNSYLDVWEAIISKNNYLFLSYASEPKDHAPVSTYCDRHGKKNQKKGRCQSQRHFTADRQSVSQSVSMAWCRAHFVDF